MGTHLDAGGDDSERVSSVDQIKDEIKKYPDMPIIICGDFNDTSMSRTYLKMKEDFSDVWEEKENGKGFTYPSDFPEKRIDYVFYSNMNGNKKDIYLEPVRIKVLRSGASDHLPVIAEFRLIRKETTNN
jgi:endonuclease/exonuclease/phosphatase (EEP) superfamily protein YafD